MKTIASKKQTKRPRIEEVQKEAEPVAATPEEQSMTDSEPVQADPISVQAPEIIHWDILEDQRKKFFRIKRMGDKYEVYPTWGKIIRSYSRSDLEEMFKVGMSLYEKDLTGAGMSLIKQAMEYLCMMFDPSKVQHVVRDLHLENKFQRIDNWMLFESCGVYVITIDRSYHEYYLVDKIYDHSKAKLQGMLNAKLELTTARQVNTVSMLVLQEMVNIAERVNTAYED
ncbi:hypothetical protein L6452_09083 [Arctium lappa]|uniref:Uncharacterized protein n=1 Tax=Arctium lappa TaxID=4217 RepID=A0ACB9DJ23_ARCLA|nr:hypothetical protein L6452_09083 [Arctium lappa]